MRNRQREDQEGDVAWSGPITPPDRHIRLGISNPTDDPSRHRVFDLRASYSTERGGWVAWHSEQNLNDQQGQWLPLGTGADAAPAHPTAAACLGNAVAVVISEVDRDAR